MMKRKLLAVCLLGCAALWSIRMDAQTQFSVLLWEQGLPNSNGRDHGAEQPADGIFTPEVKVFLPDSAVATGRAVLACPGGGYSHLALAHEGYDWASFFNRLGIAYVVLKYRLPFGHPEVPVSDAEKAMRLIRKNAAAWRINPYDVGIMGSSAGGHLAATLAVSAPLDCRPDFQILFYPVISLESPNQGGSSSAFLGAGATAEVRREWSADRRVWRHLVPPALLLLSSDDRTVPPSEHGLLYYQALSQAGVSVSMHVYPAGGHGWGCKPSFVCHNQMLSDLESWLAGLPAPRKDVLRVACVGNSITDGHGIPQPDANGYPAILGRRLGDGYLVRNFGVSGRTMLCKGDQPYMATDVYQRCKEFNPDIVVVKLGTNDSKPQNWRHKDEFISDMQQMIDELRALSSHPDIYLALPIKAMSSSFNISDSVIVNGIIPMIRHVAERNSLKVIDLYSVFEGHPEWLLPDGIHPDTDGAAVIASEVEKAILGTRRHREES